jgi:hypothetical protein
MMFGFRRAGSAALVAAALVSASALSTAWADQGRADRGSAGPGRIVTVQDDLQKRVDLLVKGLTSGGGKVTYGSAAAEGKDGVALKDVEITSADGKTAKAEAIIVREYDWENPEQPTNLDISIVKLMVPASSLDKEVTDLGVTQLTINADFDYELDDDKKTFEVSGIVIDVVELGELKLKFKLAGIASGDLKSALGGAKPGEGGPEKLLAQLSIVGAAISFKDKSLTQRLIAADAKKKGISEADAKKKMLEELAEQKKTAPDDATREVIDLAVKFLGSPGTIELVASPGAPAKVMQVFMGLMGSPAAVKQLLGLTVAVK